MAESGESATLQFARWLFRLAGFYGLLLLLPSYLMEEQIAKEAPPATEFTHPEYFYGFIGVAVAWQVAFLLIGQNPVKFRPMMVPAILEKFTFGLATVVLFLQQRLNAQILFLGLVDMLLGVLFVIAWRRLRPLAG